MSQATFNRGELVRLLNNSGISQHLSKLQLALLSGATRKLGAVSIEDEAKENWTQDEKTNHLKSQDRWILNSVGPAAAESAVEHATNLCVRQESGNWADLKPKLTNSITNNLKLIQNDADGTGYPNWSNVLRQFLLPRYSYLNFDNIVDPRHQIDEECGYPRFITPIMYRYMYDRDDVARRVVDLYPDECWAADMDVYENEDEKQSDTPFEEDWKMLCDDFNIKQYLYRMDKLCRIGHYGALLVGLDDGKELDQPIDEPELLAGKRGSISSKPRNLLYLRPFDEYLSFVHQYETDVNHPRYGMPVMYNLVFLDMTIDAAGASIGTRLNRRVHWTRVVHIADNLQSSLVFGVPEMQSVFNRILDLRKIKGASAEMFWKGGFPGLSFEIDPRFVADEPEFNKEEFREEVEKFSSGLSRYLAIVGVSAKTLAPMIPDTPENYIMPQLQAIAMAKGAPLRVLMGSEEGKLASSQDKLTWNQRLKRKIRTFEEPYLVRGTVDRFIAIGVIRPPKNRRYFTDWEDINKPTDEDKANLSLKWTQALSQYVASGVIHLIPPMDYMTQIMGMEPSVAVRIIAEAQKAGGFAKLLKVDPSQEGMQKHADGDKTGKSAEGTPS